MTTLLRLLTCITLLAVCSPFAANAFGRPDRWSSGWGQGVAEAIITQGSSNSIYVTCDQGAGRNLTGIRFMIGGDAPKGSNLTLTFDSEDPEKIWVEDGQITSNCRACAGNYDYVIDKLKSHSSVHVMTDSGESARFTLNGSRKVIGSCTADFYR